MTFSLILGGVSCAFCGVEVSPSRAGGFHAPITETHSLRIRLPAIQSAPVTSFVRVIDAILPLRRRLAGKLERSGPYSARFPALVTSYEGPRAGFLNSFRRFKAAGSLSFLRIPFVDHCSEATNSITHAFRFSPVVVGQVHRSQSAAASGLVAVSDGHRGSKRKIGNVRKSSGEIRNVIR